MFQAQYDVIVIGGGHAGCEAALASSRMGCRTLMLNLSVDSTAMMPCNPSIGGPAKGHLVREVSALGGEQARAADASTLMIRWLNTSKGAAVRALRAQCEPSLYGMHYRKLLVSARNLDISQDEATELLVRNGGHAAGVLTRNGARYCSEAVILCGGVYLGGKVFVGERSFPSGPMGQLPANDLLRSLEALGVKTSRMRTDTTPRLNISTIDLSLATPQRSEDEPLCFDIWGEKRVHKSGYACWFSRTTERTYEILSKNIGRSPLVSGELASRGPRYCPSIEDKFLRFPERVTHPIVFEPVSRDTNEVYVQNFSTSMPYDVQVEMVRSLPGCANAKIIKPGYGIEYSYLIPEQLSPSLENKDVRGLFCAGQVNGTSGYEEAAAQGLLAGINAALSAKGKDPVYLSRSDGYLGVLVDDLTTKSTIDEPYRMFTSRCEYRLSMRWDNASHRLSETGRRVGLIDDARWKFLLRRWDSENSEIERLKATRLAGIEGFEGTAAEYMRRPNVTYSVISEMTPALLEDSDEIAHVEAELRYAGYLEKEAKVAARMAGMDAVLIPGDFDYDSVTGMRLESRQKLAKFRPRSLGQALRISGVTPTDVQMLSVLLRR